MPKPHGPSGRPNPRTPAHPARPARPAAQPRTCTPPTVAGPMMTLLLARATAMRCLVSFSGTPSAMMAITRRVALLSACSELS